MDWIVWEIIGGFGQGLLLLRWIVQHYATKKAGIGRTPMMFWILTLTSSLITLPYALHLGSVVLLISFGFMVWLSISNMKVERKYWTWEREKEDLRYIMDEVLRKARLKK